MRLTRPVISGKRVSNSTRAALLSARTIAISASVRPRVSCRTLELHAIDFETPHWFGWRRLKLGRAEVVTADETSQAANLIVKELDLRTHLANVVFELAVATVFAQIRRPECRGRRFDANLDASAVLGGHRDHLKEFPGESRRLPRKRRAVRRSARRSSSICQSDCQRPCELVHFAASRCKLSVMPAS
jgi:hypothetical protein